MGRVSETIEKIIVNVGVGKLRQLPQFEEKILPEVMKELATITGQKPSPTSAKKSIAGFKVREGDVVGLYVTLRRSRMEDFFNRLIHLALPRVKDFRGLHLKNIDTNGSLNIGLREQFAFPEVQPEKSRVDFGLQITIVPKVRKRDEAVAMYRSLGVPLKKQ